MVHFNFKSFISSVVLLFIAIYIKDRIIRPFIGDTLAVIWLFYAMKSVFSFPKYWLSLFVLIFAYCVEFAQYFNFVSILGLDHIKILKIVLGSTFDLHDLLAYTIGWFIIVGIIKFQSTEKYSDVNSIN